jgi:hypothetical protein
VPGDEVVTRLGEGRDSSGRKGDLSVVVDGQDLSQPAMSWWVAPR